jgi:hypothetical protein
MEGAGLIQMLLSAWTSFVSVFCVNRESNQYNAYWISVFIFSRVLVTIDADLDWWIDLLDIHKL